MNKNIIQGKWKELKGKVKQQWGDLTDDEVSKMKGNYEELRGVLQKKYGYDQERSEKEIEKFVKRNHLDESDKEDRE
jgi:uncharacterized protein YjbJ (UPF0337 family)